MFNHWRGGFAPLFMKKYTKIAFFSENILSVKKKAVPLHRFSADVIEGAWESDKRPASLAQLARARDL